jgi:hypothetical protein
LCPPRLSTTSSGSGVRYRRQNCHHRRRGDGVNVAHWVKVEFSSGDAQKRTVPLEQRFRPLTDATKHADLHAIKAISALHAKGAFQVCSRRFAAQMHVIQNLLAVGDQFGWWITSMRRRRVRVRHREKANVGDQPWFEGSPRIKRVPCKRLMAVHPSRYLVA